MLAQELFNVALLDQIIPGFGIALMLISLMIILSQRKRAEMVFFGFSSLAVASAIVFIGFDSHPLLIQLASLCYLPLLYLFAYSQRTKKFPYPVWLQLIFPLIWLCSFTLLVEEMRAGIFNALFLIQLIIYAWLCGSELYQTKRMTKSQIIYRPYYLDVLLAGLFVLVSFRLGLALIEVGEHLMLIVLLGMSGYNLLILFFHIQPPFQQHAQVYEPTVNQELANYEEQIKRKLLEVMKKNKAYLNPSLSLKELAELTGLKLPELSHFINSRLGKNFNDFVNEYRIEEFKRLVHDDSTDPKSTIMELAYESGFNSKASFNRLFKAYTGKTPKEYRKKQLETSQIVK